MNLYSIFAARRFRNIVSGMVHDSPTCQMEELEDASLFLCHLKHLLTLYPFLCCTTSTQPRFVSLSGSSLTLYSLLFTLNGQRGSNQTKSIQAKSCHASILFFLPLPTTCLPCILSLYFPQYLIHPAIHFFTYFLLLLQLHLLSLSEQ